MMRLVALLLAGLLDAAAPHLRTDSAELRSLVADSRERSATFRQLVDRIQQSDLIVYVRAQHFPSPRLEGRIGFVNGATGTTGARILLVEIACPRTVAAQTETLAHELHHAVEIAGAVWVRDPESLEQYYRGIGEAAMPLGEGVAFETRAARETASRVRREISDFRGQTLDLRFGR
jgi:hypothetical protein